MEEGAACVVIAIATNDYGCTIEVGVLQFCSKVSGGFIYKGKGEKKGCYVWDLKMKFIYYTT